MNDSSAEPDTSAAVWDRLRERLEQMRSSAGHKLDPALRARKLAERAEQLRHRAGAGEPAAAPIYFIAFTKGRERFGIPLENVLEVQPLEHFSLVPGAPPAFRGVVHWKGMILALLDLARFFDVAETGLSDLHAYLVIEAHGKRLAVAASVVEDILAVPRDQLKAAPAVSATVAPEWLLGIHDENRLILNMEEIVKNL